MPQHDARVIFSTTCSPVRPSPRSARRRRPRSSKGWTLKLHYYPETDSLYIELKAEPGADNREVADGLNVDLDAKGEVVGFDIDHASQRLDLSTLETIALPVRVTRVT
jgi:uncharacterized protein YuzE